MSERSREKVRKCIGTAEKRIWGNGRCETNGRAVEENDNLPVDKGQGY
jgi:hypothetical protein